MHERRFFLNSFLIFLFATIAIAQDAPMFRNDPAHSGVYSAAGVPKLKGVKWTFHTRGEVVSSPAIVDGVIYVGSNDGSLYAIDQQTAPKSGLSLPRRASLRRLPSNMASSTSAATTAISTP